MIFYLISMSALVPGLNFLLLGVTAGDFLAGDFPDTFFFPGDLWSGVEVEGLPRFFFSGIFLFPVDWDFLGLVGPGVEAELLFFLLSSLVSLKVEWVRNPELSLSLLSPSSSTSSRTFCFNLSFRGFPVIITYLYSI